MHQPNGIMLICTAAMVLVWEYDLLLNPDKSEVCFFGIRQKLRYAIRPSSIRVTGGVVDV